MKHADLFAAIAAFMAAGLAFAIARRLAFRAMRDDLAAEIENELARRS